MAAYNPSELLDQVRSRLARARTPGVAGSLDSSRKGSIKLLRGSNREILYVRIGAWRVIHSRRHRRIVEVRELACQRIVVRSECTSSTANAAPYTLWELYDLEGHLVAMLQDMPNGKSWHTTHFAGTSPLHTQANPCRADNISPAAHQEDPTCRRQ